MVLCVLSMLLSIASVWIAVRKTHVEQAPPKPPLPPKSVQQRQQQAVARKEWENFMSYDGTEQAPIDPDRVLGD